VDWGYYDAKGSAGVRVEVGDTVENSDADPNSPKRLEGRRGRAAGIKWASSLRDITDQERIKGLGRSKSYLGPYYRKARKDNWRRAGSKNPWRSKWQLPYAYKTPFGRGEQALSADDNPTRKSKNYSRDEKNGTEPSPQWWQNCAPGIENSAASFFGQHWAGRSHRKARPLNALRRGLLAGIWIPKPSVGRPQTLDIPVHAPGSLFEVGDRPAAKGRTAKVDITALETSIIGHVSIPSCAKAELRWPSAETAQALHHNGLNDDLDS